MLYRTCQILVILLVVAMTGCATDGTPRVGSQDWYDARIAEIEASHDAGELTTEEYLRLKNETDQVRAEAQNRGRSNPSVSLGFGVHTVR